MSHLGYVIEEAVKTALRAARVSLPGRIVSYDVLTQTAEVKIQLEIPLNKLDTRNEVLRGQHVHEALPNLHSVPIGHPSGGGFYVHFPMAEGDFVWVMFSDLSMDEFVRTGTISKPKDITSHGLFPYAFPSHDPSKPNAISPPPASNKLVLGSSGGTGIVRVEGDLEVTGDIQCTGEVTAKFGPNSVGLSTHSHLTAMGPTSPPTPGT